MQQCSLNVTHQPQSSPSKEMGYRIGEWLIYPPGQLFSFRT